MHVMENRGTGRDVTVRIFRPDEKTDIIKADEEYWARLTPAERVELAWQLSEEQWELMEAGKKAKARLKNISGAETFEKTK
ncbi:MAG: hypothetical protein WC552_09215 [Candidatus Omnitrophota bacterium]